eukprot:5953466-Lingulodinium_polyedra.AAC.1
MYTELEAEARELFAVGGDFDEVVEALMDGRYEEIESEAALDELRHDAVGALSAGGPLAGPASWARRAWPSRPSPGDAVSTVARSAYSRSWPAMLCLRGGHERPTYRVVVVVSLEGVLEPPWPPWTPWESSQSRHKHIEHFGT